MRKLSIDKRTTMFLAQQSGAAYEVAALKGHLSVTGRGYLTAKQKEARKVKRAIAKQSRRMNRGA